jgi:methyl-accepting chemotaxis protein
MDEVTQQNAALVEEAAAAAESLEEQAQALAQAVSVFRLAGESSRSAAPPPQPAATRSRVQPATELAYSAPQMRRAPAAQGRVAKPDSGLPSSLDDEWHEF